MAGYQTDLKVEKLELSEETRKLPMLAKYDEGLRSMINQVFAGEVILAPSDRAFELYIDQSKGNLKFPFISIFPSDGYTRVAKNFGASNIGQAIYRQAKMYDDVTLKHTGQTSSMQNFHQYMYFTIPYTIDCWGTNRYEALQLVQELMFWLLAQGQVKVIYGDGSLTCNLTVNDLIVDSSQYTEYENIGNLYKFTITVTVDAPVIRTTNYLNILRTDLELNMEEVN